ncbi:hypothetical protein [Streptomyces bicolor]|uniref:hypothetical protein n=1 Tax=Streptomyces bicolor TaxID=66874 RepID=UPI00131E2F8F|nr:hypothetical protein [Streptomyces bicolor]
MRWPTRLVGVGLTTAVAVGVAASPAFAQTPGDPSGEAGVQPVLVPWTGGPPLCPDGTTGLRFEDPVAGETTQEVPGINASITIDVSEVDGEPRLFDFNVEGQAAVTEVFVKGGGGNVAVQNLFHYPNGIVADTLLHAPVNPNNNQLYGISHIDFCVKPDGYNPPPTNNT